MITLLNGHWPAGVDPVSCLLYKHQGKAKEGREQTVMMMMIISTFMSGDYVGDYFREALEVLLLIVMMVSVIP